MRDVRMFVASLSTNEMEGWRALERSEREQYLLAMCREQIEPGEVLEHLRKIGDAKGLAGCNYMNS